jgi:glycosyltransferase involved in cell wall biosynthesis
MRLTVLNVAYPFAHVGPDAVGGAEQVLSQVESALANAGHQSLVLACGGSKTTGKLFPTTTCSEPITEEVRQWHWRECALKIREICFNWKVDLVHYHGVDFYHYLPQDNTPVLATLHLPLSWYPAAMLKTSRADTWFHCVSRSQQEQCPPEVNLLPVIENGVSEFFGQKKFRKRNYAICLGRICPEKGFHLAADAARQAGLPLVLAGAVFPYQAHQEYFAQEIRPRLGARCRFIGPIGFHRKRRWIGRARCLILPSLIPETSSLVAMEALACGTPVIAFAIGALPSIVEHGKTGFLVHDLQEMAAAIRDADQIDPEACRRAAQTRFSLRRMCTCYLECYEMLVRRTQSTLKYSENGARVSYPYAYPDR